MSFIKIYLTIGNCIIVFLNKIWDEVVIPESWPRVLVNMLFKKGDKSNPSNYRPIALINSMVKIFTQIINSRLNKWCEKNSMLPEYQSGFRNGRGTLDNIFTLNSILQIKLQKPKGKVFAMFIDFKRTFPSVKHNLLWQKLSELGLSDKFIKVLSSLYNKTEMAVKVVPHRVIPK